jgi:ABC-type nitrate/sulfonate/bicarbonate transport system substrate-binding protein
MREQGVKLKLRLIAALVMAAVATLAPAVHAADVKGDGSKVRVIFNPAGTNSFPASVMQKFNLGPKYGFELQLIPANTTQAQVTALQSGAAEVAVLDWLDISRLKNAGVNMVGIAPFLRFGADFFVVPASSTIKNFGDLKGKKVGTYSRTTLNWVVARAVSQQVYKFDIEKESTLQEGAVGLLRGLVENNQVDAALIFNSLTPGLVVSGKGRVLVKITDLINQVGLPEIPFLLYAIDANYATAHPANTKAFLAAYRESIDILQTNDQVWMDRAVEMKMDEQALAIFRGEARTDIMKTFSTTTDVDIRKTFAALLAIAGPGDLGLNAIPDGILTLEYQ